MARPRHLIIDERYPGTYHIISRCVRHAWLLDGEDESRRDAVQLKLSSLTAVMGIDLYSVCILYNHFHLVLRNRPDLVATWSAQEIARRYLTICPANWQRRKRGIPDGTPPEDDEVAMFLSVRGNLEKARARLSSVSFLMKQLKEGLSRKFNLDEGITGTFWEGRFVSVPVLDRWALIMTAAYVDLNPVRAGIVTIPEEASHTSFATRMDQFTPESATRATLPMPLSEMPDISGVEYLAMVDEIGRWVFSNKDRLAIGPTVAPVFERMGVSESSLREFFQAGVGEHRGSAIGIPASLEEETSRRNGSWIISTIGPIVSPPP